VRVSSTRFCAPGSRRVSDRFDDRKEGWSRGSRSAFGRGRTAFPRSRLLPPTVAFVVEARVIHHQGRSFRSAPLSAHVAYLERDGSPGMARRAAYSAPPRTAPTPRPERPASFRFIVTPEEAAEMTDLRAFTATWRPRWRAISAPSWGLASPMGTPTPAFVSRGTRRRR
jgi:hypothetical protein